MYLDGRKLVWLPMVFEISVDEIIVQCGVRATLASLCHAVVIERGRLEMEPRGLEADCPGGCRSRPLPPLVSLTLVTPLVGGHIEI